MWGRKVNRWGFPSPLEKKNQGVADMYVLHSRKGIEIHFSHGTVTVVTVVQEAEAEEDGLKLDNEERNTHLQIVS